MISEAKVFIDSSGFKAFMDPLDDFHQQAVRILTRLGNQQTQFITSNFIVDESATLIRYKCGPRLVGKFREYIFSTRILQVNRVTVKDEAEAWDWFGKDWSKLSFTDCVTFAQLKRLGITQVLSFDHHFEQAGFTLER